MRFIVCVKQVPDIEEIKNVKTDPKTGTLIREGISSILNPFDEYAVEEAVRLKEKFGGEVVAITMGPPQANDVLIGCLSMAVDRAILLSDLSFAGADTVATSFTLAEAIKKIGKFDVIFCGQQAIDGDTGQVGPMLAENLRIPHISYVNKVEVENKRVTARREIEDGYETLQTKIPVLLTVVKGINEPRVPSFSELGEAMEKEIPVWTAEDLGVNMSSVGIQASPTVVTRVWPPAIERRGLEIKGEPEEIARQLAEILVNLQRTHS
jgi:electron transfer flavoprotein beta subunit